MTHVWAGKLNFWPFFTAAVHESISFSWLYIKKIQNNVFLISDFIKGKARSYSALVYCFI